MSRPILFFAMILTFPAFSQMGAPLFDKLLYNKGNETIPYRFLKPDQIDPGKTYPLVIFLHGAGERGNDNEVHIQHISALFSDPGIRKRYGCFVLAPQCPEDMMWASHDRNSDGLVTRPSPTQPMAMVISLIDKIEKEFPIDRSRIYLTGLSMGGYGTWDLLARFPNRFAAAVPVCGGGDTRTVSKIKHVPIWAFHGALDRVVAPKHSRVMIKALLDAGATPGYTEYPDVGHDSWVYAYQEPHLLPWMFQQHLGKKSQLK